MSGQERRPDHPGRQMAGLVALVLFACGDGGLPTGRVTPPVEQILAHLPADAWAVVGINVERVRRTPSLRKLLDRLPSMPPDIAGSCGFEKLGGVDLAVATLGRAESASESVFVALRGGFSRQEVERCIAGLSTEAGPSVRIGREESLTVYEAPRGSGKSYAYWPTGDFVILAPQSRRSPAALSQLVGAAGVSNNPTLMGYVRRVRTDAAFWMAGPLPPELQQELAGLGPGVPGLRGFSFAVDGNAGESLAVLLRLRLGADEEAVRAARAIRRDRHELARAIPDRRAPAILDRLDVARSGDEVGLQVSLSAAEADFLLDLLSGLSQLAARP